MPGAGTGTDGTSSLCPAAQSCSFRLAPSPHLLPRGASATLGRSPGHTQEVSRRTGTSRSTRPSPTIRTCATDPPTRTAGPSPPAQTAGGDSTGPREWCPRGRRGRVRRLGSGHPET